MAAGLKMIAEKEDSDLERSFAYSLADSERREVETTSPIERDEWFWRFLEFTFSDHPPIYWRYQSLTAIHTGWGRTVFKRWFCDRFKESCPPASVWTAGMIHWL